MPPRRTHTKSHDGCLQCKRRHVKCNEVHPICGPCTKREISCSFQAISDSESDRSLPIGNVGLGGAFVSGNATEAGRILELRLFHHFSTETCITIAHDSLDLHVWQNVVPKMSFSHTILLESILATSAAHLASVDTSRSKFWLRTALQYKDQALVSFNNALTTITPDNCYAVVLCSFLVFLLTIALLEVPHKASSPDPVSELLALRRLLQGIAFIVSQTDDTLKSGELGFWFQKAPETAPQETPIDTPENLQTTDVSNLAQPALYQSIAEALQKLYVLINSDESRHQETYRESCQSLQECTVSFLHGRKNDIFVWILRTTQPLLSLLEAGDEMARILFIHYGVSLHLLNDKWFANGVGKRLVQALLPSSHQDRQVMIDVVQWAKQSVGIVE